MPHHPVNHALLPHNALTADCCRVPVLVNGQWTKALLDTGSTASLLHPDLVPAGTQTQATDVQLTTVTGGKAPMLGRWEALIEIETYSACQPVWVAEIKEDCLLGMDFLCAAGISLDFGARTVTFKDGTSIPFLNDLHTPEMANKVGENGDEEGDPPCPPQWEAPFAESPLPLSDNLIPPEPDACAQSQPHAVIRIASVVPISGEESSAGKTVRGIWENSREGLNSEQQDRLWNLLYEYRHSFATGPNDVGQTHLVQHFIKTGDAQPIRQRPRRLPKARQGAAEQMIQEMRDCYGCGLTPRPHG